MTQGTISVLFGCHSVIHSFLVLLAWRKIHGRLPEWWQVICIFLHDVGHWGMNYLDDYEFKKRHWRGGAMIGVWLFGEKAFFLLAGHDNNSGFPRSDLYRPDKFSWTMAPRWWLYSNLVFEPKLANGMKWKDAVDDFYIEVGENAMNGFVKETHRIFLEREAKRQV